MISLYHLHQVGADVSGDHSEAWQRQASAQLKPYHEIYDRIRAIYANRLGRVLPRDIFHAVIPTAAVLPVPTTTPPTPPTKPKKTMAHNPAILRENLITYLALHSPTSIDQIRAAFPDATPIQIGIQLNKAVKRGLCHRDDAGCWLIGDNFPPATVSTVTVPAETVTMSPTVSFALNPIIPKPPLGVMPKYIWKEKRCRELCRALHETIEAHPLSSDHLAWAAELHDHLADLVDA